MEPLKSFLESYKIFWSWSMTGLNCEFMCIHIHYNTYEFTCDMTTPVPGVMNSWIYCIFIIMKDHSVVYHYQTHWKFITWILIKAGHVWAGFVEPAKPENLVDSEKQRSSFASGNADDELWELKKVSALFFFTLWSVFFFLEVRWPSEHSFISAFESLRGFRQRNHLVPLYSSALRDALHVEIKSLLELCAQTCWALQWRLPVSEK